MLNLLCISSTDQMDHRKNKENPTTFSEQKHKVYILHNISIEKNKNGHLSAYLKIKAQFVTLIWCFGIFMNKSVTYKRRK